jgi:hypothetical protein
MGILIILCAARAEVSALLDSRQQFNHYNPFSACIIRSLQAIGYGSIIRTISGWHADFIASALR